MNTLSPCHLVTWSQFAEGDSGEDSEEGEEDEEDEEEESEEEDDEEEEEGDNDDVENVRIMPRAEERIARAASKTLAAKSLKEAGTAPIPSLKKAEKKAAEAEKKADKKAEKKGKVVKRDETEVPQELSARDEAAFFDSVIDVAAYPSSSGGGGEEGGPLLFSQLSLSRPLLRAVERTGYVSPTPIQAQTIPHALAGKDICASAETGSGKTAGG
jgi:ATP-dependent RNA helicase DDX27